jgi:hypothetical protein
MLDHNFDHYRNEAERFREYVTEKTPSEHPDKRALNGADSVQTTIRIA